MTSPGPAFQESTGSCLWKCSRGDYLYPGQYTQTTLRSQIEWYRLWVSLNLRSPDGLSVLARIEIVTGASIGSVMSTYTKKAQRNQNWKLIAFTVPVVESRQWTMNESRSNKKCIFFRKTVEKLSEEKCKFYRLQIAAVVLHVFFWSVSFCNCYLLQLHSYIENRFSTLFSFLLVF